MKVLHVTDVDLPGRRFNGYDLMEALSNRGIESNQAVLTKFGDNPRVVQIPNDLGDAELRYRIQAVEQRHSMNGLLHPWGRLLARTDEFRDADVVHYHLIHNHFISLFDLPTLFASKPSVWTFHDPWPMTGHCIHPFGCTKWLDGCEHCPSLSTTFSLRDDRADFMWRIKQRVYSSLDADIVVASDFMNEMVQRSPLTSGFSRVHLIPFGIQQDEFLPDEARPASRRMLGIPQDDFVILFRSTASEMKGLEHILAALCEREPERSTTLITLDSVGLVGSLAHDYNIIELGWVKDQGDYSRALSACDIFVMPSMAEAFGLMALEAMAAGRTVVCFEGTALPSVTRCPECGIAVPAGDARALRGAIDYLGRNPDEAQRRGQLGRAIAADHHSYEHYLDSIASLYRSVAAS